LPKSEIANLDAVVPGYQNVVGLEIAMDDPFRDVYSLVCVGFSNRSINR
jgi:hypothetical protein